MTENQNQLINTFKFECEHCREKHSFEQFQHSIVFTGLIVLVSPSDGYLGILCQKCNKVTVNNFSLDEVFAIWEELNDSDSEIQIKVKDASSTLHSGGILAKKLLFYNSYSNYSYKKRSLIHTENLHISAGQSDLVQNMCLKEIYEQMSFGENEIYTSYLPGTKIDSNKIAIYGVEQDNINEILRLENQIEKKILPRYYYWNNLQQDANRYCLKQHDIFIYHFLSNDLISTELIAQEKCDLMERIKYLELIEEGGKYLDVIKNGYKIIIPQKSKKTHSESLYHKIHGITRSKNNPYIKVLHNQIYPDLTDVASTILTYKNIDFKKERENYLESPKPLKFIFSADSYVGPWNIILGAAWKRITDKNFQIILQKDSYDYCLDYSDEALKTDFSFLSIVELTNKYFDELKKHIEAKRDKRTDRQTSKRLSKRAPEYNKTYPALKSIISNDHVVNEIKKNIVEAYSCNAIPVMILGETGTGKELIARAIYKIGTQNKYFSGRLITVNCGGIAKELLDSELFGHVKGAFSGAVKDRIGKIEAANNGVLFLDEIGELDINHQAKLLRALDYNVITPLGDNNERTINFKLVCATNRDLEKELNNGNVRPDFYFRITTHFVIKLPPLRERNPEDIELLANHFLKEYSDGNDEKKFTPDSMKELVTHDWPGNIRRLKNFIEQKAALSKGRYIEIDESELKNPQSKKSWKKEIKSQDELTLTDKRKIPHHIFLTELKNNNGNRSETARKLGVSPNTVFARIRKMKALNMEVPPAPPQ